MNKKEEAKMKLKNYKDEFVKGIKTMFKEFFNKETNKKQRANMWTFMRLIIPIITTILISINLVVNSFVLIGISAGLIGFGGLTDYFDGKSARKYKSYSEFGQKLDQLADKIFAGVLGLNLAMINPMFLSLIVGEVVIGAVNLAFKYKYPNCDMKSCMLGRIKQWPLFATLFIGMLSGVNATLDIIIKTLCSITVLFQAATTVSYINKHVKEINELKKYELNKYAGCDLELDKTERNNNKELEKTTNLSRREKIEELKALREQYTKVNDTEKDKKEEKGRQKVIHPNR